MPYILTETRGSAPENTHNISLALWSVDTDETVMAQSPWVFARSTTKPFQVIPLLQQLPTLPLDQLALCCASHTGTPMHQQLIRTLLYQAKVPETALQCGCHDPVDGPTRHQLMAQRQAPSAIHHNCSGKHAGMLLCCHQAGWPTENYLNPDHPLQQAIHRSLQQLTGLKFIETAIDGCGAPTFRMPLHALARLYFQLANGHSLCMRQQQAMQTHPHLVGGPGRVDTGIMQASQGQVLAKVGADGVMALAHLPSQTGVAIKVWSGNEDVRNRFTLWWLAQQGWLIYENDDRVSRWQDTHRRNAAGTVVGHYLIEPSTAVTL